jgi:CheY-like chemotaxis protein
MNTNYTSAILLVEDDKNDVLFMRMAMEKIGLAGRLHVVEDGQDAIDYLQGAGAFSDREVHPLPCLVLLDTKLPQVMGLDVLQWIREQPELETMVVIMLTASQQCSDIRLACQLGANSYLVKPSNPLRLPEMMEALKRYWLTFNQPTAEARNLRLSKATACGL